MRSVTKFFRVGLCNDYERGALQATEDLKQP